MKKDRNTFFEQSSYYSGGSFPGPNMNVANAPFATGSYSNQGFYAGQPLNYNTQMPQNSNINNNYSNDYNDFESRLSKIERNISRLDARITKLENGTFYSTDDVDTNNVYMM